MKESQKKFPFSEDDLNSLKLCYVAGGNAYFTTLPIEKQHGDGWHKIPYEHNAGRPYLWRGEEFEKIEKYHVVTIIFKGPFGEPCDGFTNSPYSVYDMNSGRIPWVKFNHYMSEFGTEETRKAAQMQPIFAGTTLKEFMKRISEAGGEIYMRTA